MPYPEIEPYDHGMLDVGDGNLIYWEICGNPQGKAAVVLHGGPGSGCNPGMRRYFDGLKSSSIEKRNKAQVLSCRWLLQY